MNNEPSDGAATPQFPEGPKAGDRNTTFFDDPMKDHLLRAVVTLAMELSVARERTSTLEQLLIGKGLIAAGETDGFEPDNKENMARAQQRNTLISSILDPITMDSIGRK